MSKIKKICLFLCALFLTFGFAGCDDPDTDKKVEISLNVSEETVKMGESITLTVSVKNAKDETYKLSTSDDTLVSINNNVLTVLKDVTEDTIVTITATSNEDSNIKDSKVITVINSVPPKPEPTISVGIKGSSEVKSGQSITLKSSVSGTDNTDVIWEVKTGSEYATISERGKLTAAAVDSDKIIEVIAKSKADETVFGSKIITIVTKPELTQEMIDKIKISEISFEGYVNISLYTFGLFEKLHSTYTTVIKTAMDGENWYAEYDNADTGIKQGLFYKEHNNLACQVGVSFMNDEEFVPMVDDNGKSVSWVDSGLYNNFRDLKVSDFTFNEEIWRYEYTGDDEKLASRVVASANPYDFIVNGFALIVEEGEIMGIYAKSGEDYSILEGYKAIQELTVAINYGETVEVPTISKYSHDDFHDNLQTAIDNMRNLDSYVLDFKEITASYLTTGYVETGYNEIITSENCYFRPYTVSYDNYGSEVHNFADNSSYGYKKINENLFNTYYEDETGNFEASRAYQEDFSKSKPTFAFAPEIFRSYYVDEEEGTITYYVDSLMSPVASTFYYGVGNDINLYGIFATEGQISATQSFTPYVVVKDDYIVEAGFYFYLGSIFGVVELRYSDFNEATLPEDLNVEFETRNVPTSWSELTIEVSDDSTSTSEDHTENALEYLKEFFNDENIEAKMPFFGIPLGDSYGFGLTTIHIPAGSSTAEKSIVFYYDVPLDVDYTINSSLEAVEEYLIAEGYTRNNAGEFYKDGIWVQPVDSSLDLMIYVWQGNLE